MRAVKKPDFIDRVVLPSDDEGDTVSKRHIRQGETEMLSLRGSEFEPEHNLAIAFLRQTIRDAEHSRHGARLWFESCPDQVAIWCDVLGLDAAIVQARVKAMPASLRLPLRPPRKPRGKPQQIAIGLVD